MSLFHRDANPLMPTVWSTAGPAPQSTAGVAVTPNSAKQKVAFQAVIDALSSKVASLPINVYRRGTPRVVTAAKPAVLEDPEGTGYGWWDFAYKFTSQSMARGNVLVEPGPMQAGQPTLVKMLVPGKATFVKVDGVYKVRLDGGRILPLYGPSAPDGVKHVRAYPVPDQILGDSVVGNHARLIGMSIAAEQFGADFFADGAQPNGLLTSDQPITDEASRVLKERWLVGATESRAPMVLGAGAKYQQVQMGPAESQFLEAQEYSNAEICRMFGPGVAELFGYTTGDKMTYANVQSRSLNVLEWALDRWIASLENFVSSYLLDDSLYALIDRNALLRMTPTDRWNVNKARLLLGAATINEIRAEETQPPLAWGDEPYLPSFLSASAMVTQQAEVVPPEGNAP